MSIDSDTAEGIQKLHEAAVESIAANLQPDLVAAAGNDETILAIRLADICGLGISLAQEVAHKVVSCDVEPNGDPDGQQPNN